MNQAIEQDLDHEWLEIEGKNREDALERACVALNTTKAYLDFEFLNDKQTKLRARKSDEEQNHSHKAKPRKNANNKTHEKNTEHDGDDYQDEAVEEVYVDPTDMGKNAKAILEKILSYIDDNVEVDLKETENKIYLDILGEGTGLVIGKRGQTLEALQHVVAKGIGLDRSSDKRLVLDAEGYRERRQESLRSLAYKMAAKASREKRSVSLEPMSAMDRRVVHMALANNRHINTKSVGEGLGRKVMIVPKNVRKNGNGRSNDRNNNRRSNGNGNYKGDKNSPRLASGPSRMHDSYDVPHAPNMDVFPDNIDELADLPEHELEAHLEGNTPETQANKENKPKAKLVTRQDKE
ncbi:MAG TPA: R3H domain-containing nucleic acid-binding protein [Oligoflexia bacterium]|nr:R3H domain-containing nucleic acid-binding protein [Oligoflexia bacterium]HMR25041.1 R3H domain-containing nucleic acid-binding protein [Oligoflexia bacterium]